MMDDVLGSHFRKAGVLKYILTKADQRLQQGMGFKVTTLVAGKASFVKDTYYVVNVLVRRMPFRFGPVVSGYLAYLFLLLWSLSSHVLFLCSWNNKDPTNHFRRRRCRCCCSEYGHGDDDENDGNVSVCYAIRTTRIISRRS